MEWLGQAICSRPMAELKLKMSLNRRANHLVCRLRIQAEQKLFQKILKGIDHGKKQNSSYL